ncbi:MAG TPA: type I DNA topoisomerase [Alphaproteobacteria bacterium]|nr:type I DNA topoisomerase [Alphaproteobacteria bacterium]
MSAQNLVIVESPAKAKTINKYLGPDYTVVASFGHVRDLPAKNGSVDPEKDFAMQWEIGERSHKPLGEIISRAKKVQNVFLATDPDREGEAISWHVSEYLKEKYLADKVKIRRVTFNEITKSAVQEAFKNARDIDHHLVDAYMARRALDYLVGFTLSPVLWRKLPGSRSAGRVQSVALRLICEREAEIEIFKPEEYWSIETLLTTKDGKSFTARLSQLDGEKIEKMTIGNQGSADAAVARITGQDFSVATIERKQVRRNPYPPFITSTLQQEASRKLRFSATKTMRTAQRLYEGVDIGGETVGLITYMRTDGVTLSGEAIAAARKLIKNKFGDNYLPESPRAYKSKVKNAQEAHEAIRPTDIHRTPDSVSEYLGEDEAKLYDLIWKRTVACQMESAVLDQVSVDIANKDGKVVLRATGSIVAFDGFLKVYREEQEDEDKDASEEERRLPPLKEGDALKLGDVTPSQHFTQPPPRYTEASLVKKMEELGIGRPSTYASILQVLQDRDYVKLDQRRFIPESRGRIVTAFLMNFFGQYVEYNFTADLEEQLDEISAGDIEWKRVLRDFWKAFSEAVEKTSDLKITDVINALEHDLSPILFPDQGPEGRVCPTCKEGKLSLKLGKYGAFVGCSNYPDCRYTRPVLSGGGDGDGNAGESGNVAPKLLGTHPKTGTDVSLRFGPYGPYIQMEPAAGDAVAEEEAPAADDGKKKKKAKKPAAPKPKRAPVPKNMDPHELSLERAVALLALPREVGLHPETGEMIKAGIGRFGPFLVHQGKFKSIPADDPDGVLTIGLNRAVDLLAQQGKGRGGFGAIKELGPHPEDSKPVTINRGRYGPYVKHGSVNATIPKDVEAEAVTMEQAVEWLNARKSAAPKSGGAKKAPARKTAQKKPAAKKTAAKKSAGARKT